MSEPLAYLNGQFIPQSQLSIPINDAGFVFGATATEFVRTYHGQLFRLDDHIERFRQTCELCRIPMGTPDAELKSAAVRLGESNWSRDGNELALITFATPGALSHYGGPAAGPTLAMHTFPLPLDRYRRLFTGGARLVVPAIRNVMAIDARAKMRSRMHWWIAEQQAKDIDPQAWALLLDAEGWVTETAAANLLIVSKRTVVSPPSKSILNGITLRVARELCRQLGIPFAERPFTLIECQSADEAFLTGTAFGLAGVSSIDRVEIGWPGPLTRQLQTAFNELVDLDIAQ
jgi:branched-chain amino acid aminotransferase